MKKRTVPIIASVLLLVCLLAGAGVAATWRHWWWPVPSARVWIDGKPANQVRVFHGADNRYLLYYPNQSKEWEMDQAIVPGQNQPVDSANVKGPLDGWAYQADFVIFPFGVFTKTVPFHSWWMYEDADGDWKSANLTYQEHGFTFYNLENNLLNRRIVSPTLDRKVLYRVELP